MSTQTTNQMDMVLITSIIDTPPTPLSYAIRSVYTKEERYIQTKETIESIKRHIPNALIFIVECSELTKEEETYFQENSHLFINLIEYPEYKERIYSPYKALGESTMTTIALQVIEQNNIEFKSFHKISGRYSLIESPSPSSEYIIKRPTTTSYCTAYYKVPKEVIMNYGEFLEQPHVLQKLESGIAYETIFYMGINNSKTPPPPPTAFIDNVGITGHVSVNGELIFW